MIAIHNCHLPLNPPNVSSKRRMNAMNTAAFTTVAIKDVNTVGAPSYTSGVQKWNGAADTLNDIEKSSNSIPATGNIAVFAYTSGIFATWNVPVAPYNNAIPISINPVEKAPIRKYFSEASLLLRL